MTTFYTLDNRAIPQANIVKTYQKGTCDYKHTVTCDRCGGRGVVHVYGVCYKCNGDCKVIKKSKGYTAELLKVVLAEMEAEREECKQIAEKNKQLELDRKEIMKKANRLQLLISIGGNSSSFSASLASQVYIIATGQGKFNLSIKQMVYVEKFLQAGCEMKDQPYEKVLNYLNSFKK